MMKKMLSSLLILLLAFTTFGVMVQATDTEGSYRSSNSTGYEVVITDKADVFTETEERQLTNLLDDVSKNGNMVILTVDENTKTAQDLADSYYSYIFGNTSGVILLIDFENRQLIISSFGTLASTITSKKCDTIADNIYRLASSGDYYGCAKKCFTQVQSLCGGTDVTTPMQYISLALLSLMIGFMLCFLFVRSSLRGKKASVSEISRHSDCRCDAEAPLVVLTHQTRTYSPLPKGNGGGGGGHGGGGGGGHSSGGHGF